MKELIRLVNEWATYSETHNQATAEEFCKHLLSRSERKRPETDKMHPPDLDGLFMKVIMRFAQSYNLYARIALKDTPLPVYDNFVVLAVLKSLGEAKKTDVINQAMMDLSTGSDILGRLKNERYIKERTDPGDKRSKLISITHSGKKVLSESFKKTLIARRIFLKGLTVEDKKLCILLLEASATAHSKRSVEGKSKTIEEIEKGL